MSEMRRCVTCERPWQVECEACGHRGPDPRPLMGLRTGSVLQTLAPGNNGCCDIDHVIHNGRNPRHHRVMLLEYKGAGVPLPDGQRRVLDALAGDWRNSQGVLLSVRYVVLDKHPVDPVETLRPHVDFVWPEATRRDLEPVLRLARRRAERWAA